MNGSFKTGSKPVLVTDLSLRDGHQSILATRMRTADILPVLALLDNIGYHSLEVWGGATFDVATRFLNEDPWDRVRQMKKAAPKTPFMMLLRGQNLVGYRNYPDDVVKEFVSYAATSGIDIFRVFDALNDERNFEAAFRAIGDAGKHIQGTVVYSVTEHHMGGAIFTRDYFVKKAKTIEAMGAHSICLKDMAGLLAPYDAYELISALKDAVSVPIQLHSHYTSGMAQMTQMKAIEAGVDIVDTALSPLALRSSHPPIEPLVVSLEGTPRAFNFDMEKLVQASRALEKVLPPYREYVESERMSLIDTAVLTHQVPGGMTTNLLSQLKEADALDKLDDVLAELPRVRKDLGFPPLVTPTSQIVGIQAVQNVLFGRYKMVSSQVRDYAYGLYGRPPAPMDPAVVKEALKGYERGETPITSRPADVLQPEMEKARKDTAGLAKDDGDVLIYALYPTTGLTFLRWKYGLEKPPASVLLAPQRPKAEAAPAAAAPSQPASARARTYNVYVEGRQVQVTVDPVDAGVTGASTGYSATRAAATQPAQRAGANHAAPAASAPAAKAVTAPAGGALLTAPMPGLVIRYEVTVGQKIKAGDTVIIVESMKMQNALRSPVDGVATELPQQPGARVPKGALLAVIGPA